MAFLVCSSNHKAVLWNWDEHRGETQVRQLSMTPPPTNWQQIKVPDPFKTLKPQSTKKQKPELTHRRPSV